MTGRIERLGLAGDVVVLPTEVRLVLGRLLRPMLEALGSGHLEAEIEPVSDLLPSELLLRLGAVVAPLASRLIVWWPGENECAIFERSLLLERFEDLWAPASDDIVVIDAASGTVVVLDHEEQLFVGDVSP